MGVKIVIPVNSSDVIENTFPNAHPTYCIEEYIWDLLILMEQYLSEHCRSLTQEVKRIRLKWYSALQIGNLLRLGMKTKIYCLIECYCNGCYFSSC
ncbi:hypothetical protein CEXT_650021 [Caerostris extrusa]|uniref:Uncharacterized protein n=1 Tax=Caerostris extrusa TaxID=172846 RepID=A0AAV4U4S6_CAEEX|nr:hypothetical protein CEXT_650021 [Caerostris extrusa]